LKKKTILREEFVLINFAVIGYGYWGPNLVRNLITNSKCGKVVVCDNNEKRLNKARQNYQTRQLVTTAEIENVLDDESIKGVVIATPISTHFELAKAAMDKGKHVFVEKPLAHTEELAYHLLEISKSKGLTLMVGHTFLYSPPVIKINDILIDKLLGDIYFINIQRINLGLHQQDVNVLWDLGPHDISTLLYWLKEEPVIVSAFGRDCIQKGIPDVCFVRLQFPSQIICNINMSWLAPSKLRQTIIVGSQKMLLYDDTEVQEKVKIYDMGVNYKDPDTFGEFHLSYRSGDITIPKINGDEPLKIEMSHFIDCIEKGQKPKTNCTQGWQVVKILDAANNSLKKDGIPVTIKWD
jgi:predicted dehydrogenase